MDIEEAYALFKNSGSSGGVTQAYVDEHDAAVAAQIPHNTSDLANDSDFVSKADTDITASSSSSSISLTDSTDARVQDMKIYGKEGGAGANGLTVTATGKNILQFDDGLQTVVKNGVTFEPRSDGGIYVHGTATANATYVFCDDRSSHNVTGLADFDGYYLNITGIPSNISDKVAVQLALRVDPWTLIAQSNSSIGIKITYTNENKNTAKSIYVLVRSGATVDFIVYPMVYLNSASPEFEAYKSNVLPITTGLPLRRSIKTLDLGEIDWIYQTEKSPESKASIPRFLASSIISDAYIPSEQYGVENISCSSIFSPNLSPVFGGNIDKTICFGRGKGLFVIDHDYTDAAAFKAAVSGITLTYPSYCDEIDLADGIAITRIDDDGETVLSEPVVTPLTDAEIQAFREFRTFEGVTNITATDDPHMTVEYMTNTDNGRAVAKITDGLHITVSGTLTLTADGWSSNAQTVAFAHDTSRRNVIDITPAEMSTWADCGVYAVSETPADITFNCTSVPSGALTFRVTSMEVGAV